MAGLGLVLLSQWWGATKRHQEMEQRLGPTQKDAAVLTGRVKSSQDRGPQRADPGRVCAEHGHVREQEQCQKQRSHRKEHARACTHAHAHAHAHTGARVCTQLEHFQEQEQSEL